jgi:hypothetical protein
VTRAGTWLFTGAVLGLGLRKIYRLLASGELTLDLARGRRLRPLGPLMWSIQAPQEIVFDVIAGPVPHLLENLPAQSDRHWQRAALAGRTRHRPLGARTVVGRQGRNRLDACRAHIAARDQH